MIHPPLKFAHLVPEIWSALGRLARAGWVKAGIDTPETVLAHTLELIALGGEYAESADLSPKDRTDLLAMLEVHDMPEALEGDQITLSGVDLEQERLSKEQKFAREHAAMRKIVSELGEIGEQMFIYWIRFERSDDDIARIAREIDKYQAIERAFRYEREGGPKGLGKKFLTYSPPVTTPFLLKRLSTYTD